jgi:hypothetical protein
VNSLPIKREDFEKGRVVTETEKAILQFLNDHREEAFTSDEILTGLGYLAGQNFLNDLSSMFTFQAMLDTLSREGKISVRGVRDGISTKNYYAAKYETED